MQVLLVGAVVTVAVAIVLIVARMYVFATAVWA